MGEEPDDDGARCSTQAAVSAGHVPTLRGAYYNLAPGWGADSVRGIGWEHDDDGTTVNVGQFVRLAQCVRAKIDPEPVAVRETDAGSIAYGLRGVARHRFVGVRPTAFASLCPDQLGEHVGVDIVTLTR